MSMTPRGSPLNDPEPCRPIVDQFAHLAGHYVGDPRRQIIDDAIMMNVEDAAACSHRPENVHRLWQDANSRHYMALAILAALDAPL